MGGYNKFGLKNLDPIQIKFGNHLNKLKDKVKIQKLIDFHNMYKKFDFFKI